MHVDLHDSKIIRLNTLHEAQLVLAATMKFMYIDSCALKAAIRPSQWLSEKNGRIASMCGEMIYTIHDPYTFLQVHGAGYILLQLTEARRILHRSCLILPSQ